MKILIIATHWAVSSGKYALSALRRMGHDARSLGEPQGNAIWGMTVADKYIWEPETLPDGWVPDLVIVMDANININRMGRMPWVVYGVDNHVRDYVQFNDAVDHFFLGHGNGNRIGEKNVSWLPCGFDPEYFTRGSTWSERQDDVAMLSVMYDERTALLEELKQQIPDISITYGTGAIYDEFAKIYQNAKISLVSSAAHDIAQRVWETAAMGCLLVMDECPDCKPLGLVHKENCLIYHDRNEAVEQVQWALKNQQEAEEIAKAGFNWAQTGKWDDRLQVILNWYQTQTTSP